MLGAPLPGRVSPTVVRVRCKGVLVSENLRKLIGVAVMAAIVVVGVVATSGDDSDFTRNAAFAKDGVMAKEAPPTKGGDCCDEGLYRIRLIENRLARLEASLNLRAVGNEIESPTRRADLIIERDCDAEGILRNATNLQAYASCVALAVHGLAVEDARWVVAGKGLGFTHDFWDQGGNGPDFGRNVPCGTLVTASGDRRTVGVETRNGIVVETWIHRCPRR